MKNQSLFGVEGGEIHMVFMGGGEEGRISCRRQSIRGHNQNPPSQATSPYQNVFNGGICTSVQMLHLTTHNCFIFFFFSNLQSFLGLVSLEVTDPMETYFMHASPPSPPPSPHDLLHHSSKQLKSLELLVIKNVFKMIHTLNYLQS